MSKKQSKLELDRLNILYDNVFVKGIEVTERDEIYKPAQYDDKPEIGEVLKVGPGRLLDSGTLVPLGVKEKDIVYFNKYSSTKFNIDGSDYYIVKEEDIVGFIR